MRIRVAVFSLIAAVALAVFALKANISGQPEAKRDNASAEASTVPAEQAQLSSLEQTTTQQQPGATTAQGAAPTDKQDASLNHGETAPLPAAPARAVMLKESNKQGGNKTVNVQELLGQVRAALGGEAKLNEIKSLSISAQMRRQTQNQEQSGTVSLDFLLPDKFKRTETLSLLAGIEVTLVKALNGEQVWTDSQSSANGAQVVVSRPNTGESPATQLQDLRSEFTRYMLVLLMTAPPSSGIEFNYAGEAEAPDGRADALDVKGANGFSMRLFIDQKTHLPLMLSYRGVAPRNSMMTSSVSGASKADIDKIIKEAQAKAALRQEAEIALSFSDYRADGGVNFPHLITKSIGGKTIEEWQIARYKINPSDLKSQKFEKK